MEPRCVSGMMGSGLAVVYFFASELAGVAAIIIAHGSPSLVVHVQICLICASRATSRAGCKRAPVCSAIAARNERRDLHR